MGKIKTTMATVGIAAVLLAGTALSAQAEVVFHRGNGAEYESLDVHKSTDVSSANLQMDLFEGLYHPDAAGEPAPGAAESHTVSDDGLVYTFKLRQGATWSDGTPVTAHDFVFAWQRLVNPETASDYAYFIWPVVNAEAISKGEMPVDQLGVRAVDDLTFEVTLRNPAPYFVSSLVHHSTYPVPKHAVEKFGNDWIKPENFVGNGAFVLAEVVPQGHTKLVKNPNYWDAANVQVDTVMYYPTEDTDAELRRWEAGELDVTYDLPSTQIPRVKQQYPEQTQISPYFGTYYYAFNLTKEPYASNAKLREALSLAIDRDLIAEKILQAGQVPAYTFVPPGVPGYEPPTLDYASMTQAERDERAKKAFEESGVGKDFTVHFMYNTSENHRRVAVAIAGMWKEKLGVETVMENQEWQVFLETRDQKAFPGIARQGWIGDYLDANNFLELLRSDIGESNPSAYSNAKFDELMVQATQAPEGERERLMSEAEAIMLADFPVIPIYFYVSKHMVADHVEGWEPNLQDFHPSKYVRIAR